MSNFWTNIIINAVIQDKKKHDEVKEKYSPFDIAKGWLQLRRLISGLLVDIILISIGIFAAGFGLKGFLIPNQFIDGGATGISLLLSEITHTPLPVLLVLINAPFILLGFRVIGRNFAIKASVAIVGLALCVAFIPYPEITNDKLLIAVFGGFFLGAGIGLSVRGGAVIDGTEVLAIAVSRSTGLSIGDVILIVNVIIFSAAAKLLSVETALYAMLTYLAAAKTVDFILEGIEEYTGLTIVSVKADDIMHVITHEFGYGATVFLGERGFGKSGGKEYPMKIIYTVITRLEIRRLKTEIQRIDPNAFLVMSSIKDTVGGITKKRRHKH